VSHSEVKQLGGKVERGGILRRSDGSGGGCGPSGLENTAV